MSSRAWQVAAFAALAVVGGGLLAGYSLSQAGAAIGVLWWPQLGLLSGLTTVTPGWHGRIVVAVGGGLGAGISAVYLFGSTATVPVISVILIIHALLTAAAADRALGGRPVDSPARAARLLAALSVGAGTTAVLSTVWWVSQGGEVAAAVSRYVIPMLIGDIALAAPIILWSTTRRARGDATSREHLFHLVAVVASTGFVFWSIGARDFGYLSLLILLVVALRCGPFWTMTCAGASTAVATSVLAASPNTTGNELVPTFLLISEVAGLLMVTAVQQRRTTEVELQQARESAEQSAREFEAFSYAVAHDLRSPLRAIDGFGEVLSLDHAEDLGPDGRALLSRVRSSARYMGVLIDSLLQLAKVSHADISSQAVDLSGLARQSVERLRNAEPRPSVGVTVAGGASAHVDPPLMSIVLDNLMSNAWKFTRQIDDPHIEFGWRQSPESTTFWVTDNGIGFDMAYQEKLFQPFQRLHTVAEAAGAGIGLATTARIIERHGGSIEATSMVGRGATFTVTLPIPPNLPTQQSRAGKDR